MGRRFLGLICCRLLGGRLPEKTDGFDGRWGCPFRTHLAYGSMLSVQKGHPHLPSIRFPLMGLAADFQQILATLPPDWTDLEVDLRIEEESHYVDTAVSLSQVNAQVYRYPREGWQWRVFVAPSFGGAAAGGGGRGGGGEVGGRG